MPCPTLEDLERYATDALPDDARESLAAHMPGCAGCQDQVAALRRAAELARRVHRIAVAGGGAATVTLPVTPRPTSPLPGGGFPEYTIVKELGRGGQGSVYQAVHEPTKRSVAIKVLLEGPHASPSARRRFEREIELVAQLKHPNIVPILESGTTQTGHPYLIMEFLRGKTLLDHITTTRATTDAVLSVFLQICEAVHYAHRRGIIHRDLKPANILIQLPARSADGRDRVGLPVPRVLDFGLAKAIGGDGDTSLGVTVTGQFLGSLPWASPEQVGGDPADVDIRTDIYSLGVVLYQALTLRFPYAVDGSLHSVIDNILTAEPVCPSSVVPGFDRDLEEIVLKCLQKDRENRYETVLDLSRDIRSLLAHKPISARQDDEWYVLRKTIRRQAAPAATAIALLAEVVLADSGGADRIARRQRIGRQLGWLVAGALTVMLATAGLAIGRSRSAGELTGGIATVFDAMMVGAFGGSLLACFGLIVLTLPQAAFRFATWLSQPRTAIRAVGRTIMLVSLATVAAHYAGVVMKAIITALWVTGPGVVFLRCLEQFLRTEATRSLSRAAALQMRVLAAFGASMLAVLLARETYPRVPGEQVVLVTFTVMNVLLGCLLGIGVTGLLFRSRRAILRPEH
ncbi:MAG: serine/threonine protein kinase [Phycisphaerales bacterium]|nr:MAG: serine/threonine protein kinase [Phycisphaerales bacterium]